MNLQDQFLRRAILEIYNYRCFYTGEPVDYTNMELDHIIPKIYENDPVKLQKIIEECNLGEDFHINSLINIVPTNKYNNRRKSNIEIDVKKILYFFELTQKKVTLIEERMIELRNKRNLDQHLSMLKTHVDEKNDEKEREKLLVNILSFIAGESDDFEEQEQVYNKNNELFYRKYVHRIGLEALMPRYNNPSTECVLYFKTLKARDCMLVLDNKTVLSQLFKGIYTDPKYGTRGFLEYEKLNIKENETIDLDNVKIHLGNNRLKLSSDDIYQLCDVVDAYASMYIDTVNEIENVLKTHSFPLSKRLNNYKLQYVTYDEWEKIINFTVKHDVDAGDSEWNIFDRNRHFIKVFTKNHEKYADGYHAFFEAEHYEDIVLHPTFTSKNVCITFQFIEDLDFQGIKFINERYNWNAEMAFNWLKKELLPKALGKRSYTETKSNSKIKDVFFENNEIEPIVYLIEKEISDYKDLYETVSLIQIYFNSNPHNKYRVSSLDVQGVYKSILTCIYKSKDIDLHYLCEKLHLSGCTTTKEFVKSINELIKDITDVTINGVESI